MTLLNDVKEIKNIYYTYIKIRKCIVQARSSVPKAPGRLRPLLLVRGSKAALLEEGIPDPGKDPKEIIRQMPRVKELFKQIMIWPHVEFYTAAENILNY